MRTRHRTLSVLLALTLAALVLPMAATAGAKGKPEPVFYEVTMALKPGSEGLATTSTCTDDGFIKMEFGGGVGYKAGWALPPGGLAVTAPDIGFLGECHGDQTSDPPPVLPAILQITADAAGNPTGLVWHFDYYATQTTYGKNKVRTEVQWLTLRSLCDPAYADCREFEATKTSDVSGTRIYDVSGTFTLYRWDPALSPLPVFQGSSLFEFEMTFTAVP